MWQRYSRNNQLSAVDFELSARGGVVDGICGVITYDVRMPLSIIIVSISFVVLAVAWMMRKRHVVHMSLMGCVMLFDLLFPIWLYMTHDWVKRLIDNGEILSFAIWAHVFLFLTLYAMYILQIQAGLRLYAGHSDARPAHRLQGRGVVIARLFVFLSGTLLIAPD